VTDPRKRRAGQKLAIVRDLQQPLRVAFYLRVSPDESLEDDQESTIGNQRGYLGDRYAANFGQFASAKERMVYVGEYVDDQITGTIPLGERPGGADMLVAARRREFDAVIVLKIDRFGRTARYMLDAKEELAEYGVAIISATEPVDTSPRADPFIQAVNDFVFQLLASIAQLDRATFMGRAHLGRRRQAKAGRFGSGPVPLGFEVDEAGLLIESERTIAQLGITEAELIREIFRRVKNGASAADVCAWLNAAGVPATTRYNHKKEQRTHDNLAPRGWHTSRINRIIHEKRYIGTRLRRIGVEEFENDLGFALVDPMLFATANAALEEPKRQKRRATAAADYLLRGLLVCLSPACVEHAGHGRPHAISGTAQRRRGHVWRYYRCSGATHSGGKLGPRVDCQTPALRADDLEGHVLDAIEAWVHQPSLATGELEAQLAERLGLDDKAGARRDALLDRLATLQKARQSVRDLARSGALTTEEAEQDLVSNASNVAAVKQQLDLLEGRAELVAIERARLHEAQNIIEELACDWAAVRAEGGERLQGYVRRLVRRVEVTPLAEGVEVRAMFVFEPVRPSDPHICMWGPSGRTDEPLTLSVPLGLLEPRRLALPA
jgi:site-specific DNA recombinase